MSASRARAEEAAGTTLRVGTAGWSYADWEGVVYPPGAARGLDRLAFIASLFDTVEVNTFFYRLPEETRVAAWAWRVRQRGRFRFTVKAWQELTHGEAGPPELEQAAAAFARSLRPLLDAGCLGAVLLQFPYRFRPAADSWERLERLAAALEGLPLVAEFRRDAWGASDSLARLRGLGMGFCNIDQPDLPGNLPPTTHLTSSLGYVRLHGRNAADWFRAGAGRDARYDYLYSERELAEWVDRIRDIEARGAQEIFVIANNHYRGKAACNALELRRLLQDPGAQAPPQLAEVYPRLGPPSLPAQRKLF